MGKRLEIIAGYFKEDMIDYVLERWDDVKCDTSMSREEAETYLGHSVRGMSKEEIAEEMLDIQYAYFAEGNASLEEVIEKFVGLMEG